MADEFLANTNISTRGHLQKLQFAFVHCKEFLVLKVFFFLNIVPSRVKRAAFFFGFHHVLLSLYVRNKV